MRIKTVILAALAAATMSASADKIVLKSGSCLTGSVAAVGEEAVTFVSDDFGELAIKLDSVASLETETVYEEGAVPFEVTKPVAEAEAEAEEEPDNAWHGSINVNYLATRGNSYGETASVLFNINRRWEEDRVKGDLGYHYAKTGTSKEDRQTSANRLEAEGQHDHFWTEKVYSYENARYDRDLIAGLKYRLRLGAGLGYQWLDGYESDLTGKWSFSQEAGLAWVRTGYTLRDPDAETSYCSFRYAHHLTYLPKWNEGVEGFHNLEYMPDIADWEVFLMKCDIGFSTKILMDFDLLCKIEWDYNSTPSAGRKRSDMRYIVGLGYKW